MLLGRAVLAALPWAHAVQAEPLHEYAQACDTATQATMTGFDCMSGQEIPMTGQAGGDCDKPPYLPSATCRKGSRLGVQPGTPADTAIVWLCRKKQVVEPGSAVFDDIAAIQTNFKNGATCFFQRLEAGGVDGSKVPAPISDKSGFWFEPKRVREEECASCHDSGLLRTPYLTQVVVDGHQLLPTRRHTTNYWFVGQDLAEWNGKVFKINDTKSPKNCTKCHAMGANTIDPDYGTSTWLGLMATGAHKTPFLNPPHDGRAFWMSPKLHQPKPEDQEAARRMAACALNKGAECALDLWGGQIQAILDSLRGRQLPELKQPATSP
jgi:hypothetical protein